MPKKKNSHSQDLESKHNIKLNKFIESFFLNQINIIQDITSLKNSINLINIHIKDLDEIKKNNLKLYNSLNILINLLITVIIINIILILNYLFLL